MKKGNEILEILRKVSISEGYGERLLGEKVKILEVIKDYGTTCYRLEHEGNRWTIPIECFEPIEITNWRGEFENKGRATPTNSIIPNGGD